jgi:DNA-binding response OmpR family regulator
MPTFEDDIQEDLRKASNNQKEYSRLLKVEQSYKKAITKGLLKKDEPDQNIVQPLENYRATSKITVDDVNRHVFIEGTSIKLTTKEFKLFQLLYANRGNAVSKEQIVEHVYFKPLSEVSNNSVMLLASGLIRKINTDPDKPLITNVWGVGYRFG